MLNSPGSEWIVDAYGCRPDALRSQATLEAVFARASVARREWGARFDQGPAVAADGPREP